MAKDDNYLGKLIATVQGSNQGAGVHLVEVRHDLWCAIFRGGRCNCDPYVIPPKRVA
jgi:hypothetical protein